jgi:hypothetical protein
MRKKIIIILGILIILSIVLLSSGNNDNNVSQEKKASEIYEQTITDNANTVIDKIPQYASEHKVCPHKDGFLVEDPYNAEWYVSGNEIFAVNGLAKSLTPNISYAPEGISYQTCY